MLLMNHDNAAPATARHGSRVERIERALHNAGLSGATTADLAALAGVPRYVTERIVRHGVARRRVTIIGNRRDAKGHHVEVWACHCRIGHGAPKPTPGWADPETQRLARIGIANARAALSASLRKSA
ncbi:MAG TPA: hypothetical protein VHD87_15680 [Acidimicrobiales bacterium]|nr:hypothetical protein [Acidimicrobiales bacterium]